MDRGASAIAIVAQAGFTVLVLAACSSTAPRLEQTATPARPEKKVVVARRICVIDNPGVSPDLRDAFAKVLSEKGYRVQAVSKTPPASKCPLASSYTAFWESKGFLLPNYVFRAEVLIYRNGKPAGRVESQPRYKLIMDREFAESTLKQMADQVLPK